MLIQCEEAIANQHINAVTAHTLPAPHAAALSIHAGPLVSHRAAMIANVTMPPMMCIDHWHAVPTQDTGCVDFKGSFALEPECLSEIASDVIRIAPPMAFCRGVSEQPVSNDSAITSASFIDAPCVDRILPIGNGGGVTRFTVHHG